MNRTIMRYFGDRFNVWVRPPAGTAIPVAMVYGETVLDLKKKIGLLPGHDVVMRGRVASDDETFHTKDAVVDIFVSEDKKYIE
jgi:hypothetical protein